MNNRNEQLAHNIIVNSISLKKNDNLLIELIGKDGIELANEIIKQARKINARPILKVTEYEELRKFLINATDEEIKEYGKKDYETMRKMQAYIGISSPRSDKNLEDVPQEKLESYNKNYTALVHLEQRVKHAMEPLKDLMNKTDKVHIIAPGTDITFSIKGIPAEKYMGTFNIPDGEVASAPVKESVNGFITYNTETTYNGYTFNNIKFEFKDGKIIKATSNNTEMINKILDTDEGARYIGEFAFGLNPYVERPIGDTLFDEKIKGSFHFTPGAALEESDNGNRSSIHWDIVNIQRKEYGGGEIYFDDILIRKDGIFVLPELLSLNPENLI